MVKFLSFFSRERRILFYISLVIKVLIVVALFSSVVQGRLGLSLLAFAALVISFVPTFIGRRYKIFLPPEFEFIFLLFLYSSFILGEMRDFYVRYPWWDLLLHSLSAIMLGLVGFMIVYSLYYTHKVVFAPVFAALFSFSFAIAMGTVWEIFEFGMDSFLGWDMQRSGLMDTMWDLVVDTLGALVVSVSGFFYLKGGDSLLMDRLVKKFIRMNEARLKKSGGLV